MSRNDSTAGTTARTDGVRSAVPLPSAAAARTGAAGLALVSVAAVAALRLALNAPGGAPPLVHAVAPGARALGAVGPPAAALALGALADDPLSRIGLLAVGVFVGLAAVVPAAAAPAVGVLATGGALAVAGAGEWPRRYRSVRRMAVPAGLLAAVVLALGSATGTLPPTARGAGSWTYLVGAALTPLYARPDAVDWFLGGVAAAGVVAAGAALPYVTGAVALVALALVDAPLLLLAAGVGGGVVATAALARSGRALPACGVATVVLAGAPASTPRAGAVVVGLSLLVAGVSGGE